MKKMVLLIILTAILLAACQPKPSAEEVVLLTVDCVQNGDLDSMMALFAEDVKYTMSGFSPEAQVYNGKNELRDWMKSNFEDNLALDIQVASTDGKTVTTSTKFAVDTFRSLGIDWMECKETYQVQDGLIQEWRCDVTAESLAALDLAMNPPLASGDIAGKWAWAGDTYQAFFTFFEDETYTFSRVIGTDEMIYDSGSILLEDGVLIFTTGDEPKYCPSGSQGVYEIALTDDGQLEMNLQDDPALAANPLQMGRKYFNLVEE